MTRYEAMEFDIFSYNGDMDYIKESSVGQRIHQIYDDFENIINTEIDKLNNKIHKGFCSDRTQNKNYEILERISILEDIKKQLL